jgi:hypothetical protein
MKIRISSGGYARRQKFWHRHQLRISAHPIGTEVLAGIIVFPEAERLAFTSDNDAVSLFADPEMLATVLIALIDNASRGGGRGPAKNGLVEPSTTGCK